MKADGFNRARGRHAKSERKEEREKKEERNKGKEGKSRRRHPEGG